MLKRSAPRLLLTGLLSLMALGSGSAMAQSQSASAADVTTEQVKDWEIVCPKDRSLGPCTITQLVNNPDNDQPVMRVVVAKPPQIDSPVMTFFVPLGVHLASGVQLSVDGGQPVTFPYQMCQPEGCRADLPLQPSLQQSLQSGNTAIVTLSEPNGNRRSLNISLIGFTGALGRIQ